MSHKNSEPKKEYDKLCRNLTIILQFKSTNTFLRNTKDINKNLRSILNDLYKYRAVINLDSKSEYYIDFPDNLKAKLDVINHYLFRSIVDIKELIHKRTIKTNDLDNLIKFYTYVRDYFEVKEDDNSDLKVDLLSNLFSTI
jgi:hypothetical protein